jgi:hypothetical protein
MKPFSETLRGKLLDHNPRLTVGDQEVLDMPDEDHVVEVVAPRYQMPKWEVLSTMRELARRGRRAPEHAPNHHFHH